jgi:acetoacetyl-CoA synthetase
MDSSNEPTDEPLWTPTAERVAAANLTGFAASVGQRGASYEEMHQWSIDEPDEFWQAIWDFTGVVGYPGDTVLERGESMRFDRYFPGASLNIVDTFLRFRGDDEAIVAIDERGIRRAISRDELHEMVAATASALKGDGVGVGDRVVAWMPNVPETIIVMLAAASIGAVFSSTSPDFGVSGVIDRFGQIEPIVLVACDGYLYGGKRFEVVDRLAEIVRALSTLRRVVVLPHLGDVDLPDEAVAFADWIGPHRGAALETVPLPFDHPWYVLYSSGTTGKPKCIVHRAGGVLLKHLMEHQLHCDIRPGDRVLYFTTAGWMMWNWLASVLATGATALLYDGSPFHPNGNVLFDIADAERTTLLGVSAKFIDSCAKAGLDPSVGRHLEHLRTVCSTGSPLSPEGFRYIYEHVKADVHLASISGGTDLCGCFVGGDPTGPVWAGEIQRPVLGMAVDVWGPAGESVPPEGGAGELVCTHSFPSMPLGFWKDDDGSRYRAAYYERFDDVWAQGDFASWTGHGGIVVHGRSDATLNPGGVRIGTAEIYRVVEQLPQIMESLVFGQQWDGDTRIVLLVRLSAGVVLDDVLRAAIRARIRSAATPRHVPAVIAAVDDLPRTRSNKLAELAVADVVHGRPVRNTEALANPEALDAIASLPELTGR